MNEFSVTALPAAAGTCTVMLLAGEADLTTTALRDARTAETAREPRLLLLDLTALTFIDSGATQMITGVYQALSQNGGTLALIHPGRTVGRVLELTGINQIIHVYDTVSAPRPHHKNGGPRRALLLTAARTPAVPKPGT